VIPYLLPERAGGVFYFPTVQFGLVLAPHSALSTRYRLKLAETHMSPLGFILIPIANEEPC